MWTHLTRTELGTLEIFYRYKDLFTHKDIHTYINGEV